MSETVDPQVINVEPHPRLLSVLGDIEFAPWQCLAELIDNAFDEFVRQDATRPEAPGAEPPMVTVSLPGRDSGPSDAEVWVSDNGAGMAVEQLRSALRAGWSSNDRFGRLGLYGVGFNIATARLGHIAVVKTARAADPAWTVVTLDLRALARGDHYNLPVATEPKGSPGEHGTRVVIRQLKPEHYDSLRRPQGQTKIRAVLGDVYSYLLAERGFILKVDQHTVQPRRACVWDESRSVVRRGERIPAVIKLDEQLPDRSACLDCGAWQDDTGEAHCQSCGSDRLTVQKRRIWGWLGIQRYLHASDYGIDFLRNGRKILLRDVSLFQWHDPDDPSGRGEQEYPIEVPPAGRIVGEIHIDHVRVNYQKNAFEYDTPEWKKVRQVLRGRGPLLPKSAKEAGYETNTSPLARLIAGYRRNDAGLNYLTPGDGKAALHEQARAWAKRFRDGDEKYQSDEEWYRAAKGHDDAKNQVTDHATSGAGGEHRTSGGDAAGGATGAGPEDILRRKGLLDPPEASAKPASAPPAVETEEQRRQHWRDHAQRQPGLETSFGLPGHGKPLDVTAYLVQGETVRRPDDSRSVPVYVAQSRGSSVEVFIDASHKVFTEFAVDTRDLVVVELAEYLRVRSGDSDTTSLSALFYELKNKCLPDHKVTPIALGEVATGLLEQVREGMGPVVAGSSAGYWSLLTAAEQSAAEQRYAAEGGAGSWIEEILPSGDWIEFVPGMALVHLLKARPEVFLDGRVFRSDYERLSDDEARAMSAERVVDLLGDVAVLADRPVRRSAEDLQRGRLSCVLLERELVAGDSTPS